MSSVNYAAFGELDPRCRFIVGDCCESLRTLSEKSVQTCITSPPYFGLRDYDLPPTEWPVVSYVTLGGIVNVEPMMCCLGLEPTPAAYVGHLVTVFREVRRVLRGDGTLWLNLGDSYAGSWGNQGRKIERGTQRPINGEMLTPVLDGRYPAAGSNTGAIPPGADYKAKDLLGIPWMVAFALRADGWYLRSDVIWNKPNPMPESVRDRPTKAHEYVFLLSKGPRYYWDADAIREPHEMRPQRRPNGRGEDMTPRPGQPKQGWSRAARDEPAPDGHPLGRNRRSVWTVATQPYSGAHFATFPAKLVEPCILSGCPEGGTVLDPFAGAGTTGMVALRHGRSFVGCELSPEYVRLACDRIIADQAPKKKRTRSKKTSVAS